MCQINCILFGAKELARAEIVGKRVIDVGSRDVNGSIRPLIESWKPSEYVGVDLVKEKGVDVICDAGNLVEKFGKNSFDVVICMETLEHVRDWKTAISNLKNVCKPDGIILITTISHGFGYHAFPHDFWRYEKSDMLDIFSDCRIASLEQDGTSIFLKIIKPAGFKENALSDHKLYSIISDGRISKAEDADFNNLHFRMLIFKLKLRAFAYGVGRFLFATPPDG